MTTTPRATILPLLGLAGMLAAVPARASFDACLAGIQAQAAQQGVSAQAFRAATAGISFDDKVIELSQAQPEFKTPIWDYMAALVDEERVEDGRAAMRQHAAALAQAEARYGVDRHTIAAVWGVESNFGKNLGKMPLVQSLATLACSGNRRRDFFRGELLATLKIIAHGDIAPERLTGSWAGAFGQTQFMPTTYQRLAVDLDGDGRRDVVDSVADAVGSTANFLRAAKWHNGTPWGYEVRLPRGFNVAAAGRKNKHAVGHWASLGVTRVDGRPLTGEGPAGIIAPAGIDGPAFLVTKNFDAIYSYNAAESYGLAIAVLSDRLRGRPGVQAEWPTDDPPLSRAERRDLQVRLTRRGYDVGEPDGKVGQKTRDAIKAVERELGMPQTGRPGGKVLEALRRG
ncbi:lytic murein transglycosylase [Methylobacterium gregans]|uniref:Tn3 family transposase TnXax1 n=1 Tax=Methylobacterium gregans TaxID=374424 RepID=A0AA37MDD8_9HYPH|nr:lytic murein transglycosylase [Methylobacterium gregans]MDQ0522119.1 lytic murein transglycosylase [Methylobacterium gregans]GJD80399.1 Tn3 family transposase TnXax1 [Methylobacterium gregans]GLS51844.1 peptidoglycan-binding protein [Methylobacterium gregans]